MAGQSETNKDEEDKIAWPPPGYRTGNDVLDQPVQATHLDAAGAKKVCADLGYFEDPWLKHIVPAYMCQHKSPMIHRGYYVRTTAMRRAAEHFIRNANKNLPIQIVNLGAGLDTLYFWVHREMEKWGRDPKDLSFFEVDFPVIISKKTRTIVHKDLIPDARNMTELSPIHQVQQLRTPHYRYVACDMRQTGEFKEALFDAGFNAMGNTLFLSECVLVYMQPEFADNVIGACKELCLNAQALQEFVVYEQCNPDTAFGRQMVRNLHARGCSLMGMLKYKTPDDNAQRYQDLGWTRTKTYTLNQYYDRVTTEEETKRIVKLELLDELEEFRLIQDHYFLMVACNEAYDPAVIF